MYIYIKYVLFGERHHYNLASVLCFFGGRIFTSWQQPTKKKKGMRKCGGANDTKDFILKRNETQVAIL